jgi:plastocyanin
MNMVRRIAVSGLLAWLAGTGAGAAPHLAHATAPAVTVALFQYRPASLTVAAGTRVVWTNQDEIVHTVTAPGAPAQRAFDGTLDGKGASIALTFTAPGDYPYACERHPHMRGEIRVE